MKTRSCKVRFHRQTLHPCLCYAKREKKDPFRLLGKPNRNILDACLASSDGKTKKMDPHISPFNATKNEKEPNAMRRLETPL